MFTFFPYTTKEAVDTNFTALPTLWEWLKCLHTKAERLLVFFFQINLTQGGSKWMDGPMSSTKSYQSLGFQFIWETELTLKWFLTSRLSMARDRAFILWLGSFSRANMKFSERRQYELLLNLNLTWSSERVKCLFHRQSKTEQEVYVDLWCCSDVFRTMVL